MNDSKSVRKPRVAEHIAALPKSGIREFFDIVSTMSDVISLGVGEPDFVSPWSIREGAIFSLEKGRTAYTSNLGMLSLRQEICRYVRRNYDVDYDPVSECMVTIGVSEAVDLAIRALVNPGDEVLYVEPSYVSYPAEVRMAHGVPVPVATVEQDAFALNPATLRTRLSPRSRLLILNFPCNPTGAELPLEQMREIAAICIEHDLIVITDEIYSELLYEGEHHSIAALPGMRERTVFLHGFSKAFAMTGWRVGYACGPHDIIDAMMKIHQYSIMCASITAQEGALEALRSGEKSMLKMRESYRERRNLIVDGFNRIGLRCLMPKGAFYAFPNITSTGMTSLEFSRKLLEQKKVVVVPGTAFGAGGEGFVRACYATAAGDILRAIDLIDEFLRENRR